MAIVRIRDDGKERIEARWTEGKALFCARGPTIELVKELLRQEYDAANEPPNDKHQRARATASRVKDELTLRALSRNSSVSC